MIIITLLICHNYIHAFHPAFGYGRYGRVLCLHTYSPAGQSKFQVYYIGLKYNTKVAFPSPLDWKSQSVGSGKMHPLRPEISILHTVCPPLVTFSCVGSFA